jgi:hypothetical protein
MNFETLSKISLRRGTLVLVLDVIKEKDVPGLHFAPQSKQQVYSQRINYLKTPSQALFVGLHSRTVNGTRILY